MSSRCWFQWRGRASGRDGSAPATPLLACLAAALLLSACARTPNRAPVEERGAAGRSLPGSTAPVSNTGTVESAPKPLPGAENAGKPGYYSVKPGDTLIRIGLENGQNWRDLMRWNSLDNPNLIEVGQVLRVVSPNVDPTAAATRPVTVARVETRPLEAKPPLAPVTTAVPAPPLPAVAPPAPSSPPAGASPFPSAPPASAPAAASAGAGTAPAPPAVAIVVPSAPRDGDDDINWAWPSADPVVGSFDETKVKGLVFGGKAGDPVLAAAEGRVVYAGSGLRGYGNLIILKHNSTYLTAYAHNQALLVKEDQTVRRGQKIAEMGSTDADGVRLHFEIRRQGKPIDPARLLPPR